MLTSKYSPDSFKAEILQFVKDKRESLSKTREKEEKDKEKLKSLRNDILTHIFNTVNPLRGEIVGTNTPLDFNLSLTEGVLKGTVFGISSSISKETLTLTITSPVDKRCPLNYSFKLPPQPPTKDETNSDTLSDLLSILSEILKFSLT